MKTQAAPSFQHCIRLLHRRIAVVRARRMFIRTATGMAASLALLVTVFTVEAVLDDLVDLPWVARALIFVCNLAGSGWLLWRDCVLPFRKKRNDDAIALMIEHAMPVFRTRFIASIQLARATSVEKPHAVVRALLAETAAEASKLNFNHVIKTKRMRRALLAAAGAGGIAAALIWFAGPAGALLIKRALLFTTPLPHKTQILAITGDKKIGVGEDFKLEVRAGGVLPQTGQVSVTTASGAAREFTLERTANSDTYIALIHSQQENFSYFVKLNDDTSQTYHVSTLQRPVIMDVACEQVYPAYTKLPPVNRPTGDLTLLAGSTLKVTARGSIPLGQASFHLAGLDKDVPMRIDPANKTGLAGEIQIPVKDLTGFSIHLMSTEGAESGETATYRIDIVRDQEPTVKITYPLEREELATQQAKVLVAFEARDDFGIAKVELHYTIDQGPEKVVPFDLGGRADKQVDRRYLWELDKFQPPLAVGNVIEFWITVTDTNDVTGPGIGSSEHYQTKIVTDDEKRADLANRLQDTISGVKEVTGSEEELNKTLGQGIFAKPKDQ